MLRIDEENRISLTRGDTAYLTVPIFNDVTEEEYTLDPEDTLTLTCKRSVRDTNIVFQKILIGKNVFHILPTDTSECDFKTYKYDVQLTRKNGDVCTVIEPTDFIITSEVTI